jgi:hypothetical protein
MINLLPPAERQALRREYRLRVGVVFLLYLLAAEVVLAVMFVPAAYALWLTSADLEQQLEKTRSAIPPDIAGVEQKVANLQKDIDLLMGGKDVVLSKYLLAIAKAKPAGVTIAGFSLESGASPSIVIKGYAATRADLLAFRANLRNDTEHFLGADFEAKYLLREPIDFSGMKIILKP